MLGSTFRSTRRSSHPRQPPRPTAAPSEPTRRHIMNLLRAEWSRLFARRFTTIMVLVVIAILSLVALGVALDSHKPGTAATAAAKEQADRERQNVQRLREQCHAAQSNPDQAEPGRYPPDMNCDEVFDPARVQDENFMPNVFVFRDTAHSMVLVFGGLFILLAFA